MTPTLQTLLDERAVALPGRERERAALLDLVLRDRPLLAVVHGIAGVGKSALARAFAGDARKRGAVVLELDGRSVEPTERGFLAAVAGALQREPGSLREIAAALAALPGRAVLVVDHHERLRLLDTWMRLELVPALPANLRVVLSGREDPGAWGRDFGDAARVLRLGNLEPSAARQALARAGVADERLAEQVDRLARGHPLALQLAAAALAADGSLARADAAAGPVIDTLAELYLASLDARTRGGLDAACLVRRATIPLLGAMLPDERPDELFALLRRLPFVDVGLEGLVVHDTVREVTAALLRSADPVAHRRLRTAAWRQLRREVREASAAQLWRYTADLLYLVEQRALHEACFPAGPELYSVEPARPEDGDGLEALARAHASPDALATLRAVWAFSPEAVRVARDPAGAVAGFACVFHAEAVSAALVAHDPVLRLWREHRRRHPVPRGQRVLYVRESIPRGTGRSEPSLVSAALWLDIKRDYLELRPALRRVYVAASDLERLHRALDPLGFAPLEEPPVEVAGVPVASLLLDMGPASVDGWLSDVVGRELHAADEGVVAPRRRELVLDGRTVALTRLEADVLRYLQDREGDAVERESLLRDVWGHEWIGGSNVVEVVVSALRRKLGDRAAALETVRGVGYRLRPLR